MTTVKLAMLGTEISYFQNIHVSMVYIASLTTLLFGDIGFVTLFMGELRYHGSIVGTIDLVKTLGKHNRNKAIKKNKKIRNKSTFTCME